MIKPETIILKGQPVLHWYVEAGMAAQAKIHYALVTILYFVGDLQGVLPQSVDHPKNEVPGIYSQRSLVCGQFQRQPSLAALSYCKVSIRLKIYWTYAGPPTRPWAALGIATPFRLMGGNDIRGLNAISSLPRSGADFN